MAIKNIYAKLTDNKGDRILQITNALTSFM